MATEKTLDDLFLETLKDVYHAEKQLVKTLPKMAKAAQDKKLADGFLMHAEETEVHVERLEQIFELLGKPARGKTCEGMKGLIEEGQEKMSELDRGATLDAALIASAQKVEHYEIASYGTLATFAEIMGHQDAKDLLGQTLDEEKEADEKLTQVAGQINFEADAEEGEEQEAGSRMVTAAPRSARGGSSGRSSASGGRSNGSRSKKR